MRQVLAAIVAVLLPLSSFADEPTAPSQRDSQIIEQLLRRIVQLEKRVAALESRVAPQDASPGHPIPSHQQGQWVPGKIRLSQLWGRCETTESPGSSREMGMKADEIEYQQRIYLRDQGVERLDPELPPYPRRAIGRD